MSRRQRSILHRSPTTTTMSLARLLLRPSAGRLANVLGARKTYSSASTAAAVTTVSGSPSGPKTRSKKSEEARAYRPSYAHVIEKFLDTQIENKGLPLRCAGFDWSVARPGADTAANNSNNSNNSNKAAPTEAEEEEELFHWSDEQQFPDGIVRVEIASPLPQRLRRFVEIHFRAWFMLLHQHDLSAPRYRPSQAAGYWLNLTTWSKGAADLKNWTNQQPNINGHDITPLSQKPLTLYHGLDVPAPWLLAMKKVRWPKLFVPDYHVDYYEFFHNTAAVKNIQNRLVKVESPDESDGEPDDDDREQEYEQELRSLRR